MNRPLSASPHVPPIARASSRASPGIWVTAILFAETRKPIAALPAAFRAPPIALMHDATYIHCPLRSGLGSEGQAILGKKFAVSEEGSRECTRKFALIMR